MGDGWPGSLVIEFHHRQDILLDYIVYERQMAGLDH